jgi:hypothetical protein
VHARSFFKGKRKFGEKQYQSIQKMTMEPKLFYMNMKQKESERDLYVPLVWGGSYLTYILSLYRCFLTSPELQTLLHQ